MNDTAASALPAPAAPAPSANPALAGAGPTATRPPATAHDQPAPARPEVQHGSSAPVPAGWPGSGGAGSADPAVALGGPDSQHGFVAPALADRPRSGAVEPPAGSEVQRSSAATAVRDQLRSAAAGSVEPPAGPRGQQAFGALRDVVRVVREESRGGRRERRLTAEAVDALRHAGFARHFVPRRHGGVEGRFGDVLRAAAEVGEGCASAGWCAALWAAHGRYAALLPEEAGRAIWADGPDTLIAAAIAPAAGIATRTVGGWAVAGTWTLVSGVDHAEWLLLAAMEEGSGAPRACALPRAAVTVHDTWDSVGLRATGSHTVSLPAPVFVPDEHTAPLAALLAGDPRVGAPRCHAAPAHLAGGLLFCAPALGAARATLDACFRWAGRPQPAGVPRVARPAVQEALTRAAAAVDAVDLVLRTAADRADTGPADAPAVARNRRDAAMAAQWLAAAAGELLGTGGAHLREADGEVHRRWADVVTIASHGALDLAPAAAVYAPARAADSAAAPGER